MAKCFSFTESRDWCYCFSFKNACLRSSTVDLGDGTIMHCWVPKTHKTNKFKSTKSLKKKKEKKKGKEPLICS